MATATAPRPSAHREIPVRRLSADLTTATLGDEHDETDPWLVSHDPVFSHFLAVLSGLFPQGEEFFVRTVRDHRSGVDDEVLRRQINAFIGQEAMHGREHRALNVRLAELGYPVEAVDRGVGRICARLLRLPGALPLAVTAAAEHLTGTMAEILLDDDATKAVLLGRGGDLESLVQWHALEELEHKNVAFDVLETVDGRYLVRAAGFWIMLGTLGLFGAVSWRRGVRGDRRIQRRHRRRFRSNFRRQKMLSWPAARALLGYLRPGFHPDDTDTDHLVAEWRVALADRTVTTGSRASTN